MSLSSPATASVVGFWAWTTRPVAASAIPVGTGVPVTFEATPNGPGATKLTPGPNVRLTPPLDDANALNPEPFGPVLPRLPDGERAKSPGCAVRVSVTGALNCRNM